MKVFVEQNKLKRYMTNIIALCFMIKHCYFCRHQRIVSLVKMRSECLKYARKKIWRHRPKKNNIMRSWRVRKKSWKKKKNLLQIVMRQSWREKKYSFWNNFQKRKKKEIKRNSRNRKKKNGFWMLKNVWKKKLKRKKSFGKKLKTALKKWKEKLRIYLLMNLYLWKKKFWKIGYRIILLNRIDRFWQRISKK